MHNHHPESLTKQIVRHNHSIYTIYEIAEKAKLLPTIHALQNWQKLRFLDSQQNLYQNKQTNPAIIYIASQFFQLDHFILPKETSVESILKVMKFIPKEANQVLVSVLALNAVNLELDFSLAQKLKHSDINPITYNQAFSQSGNMPLRKKQLELLQHFCERLEYLTRIRGNQFLLKIYEKSAKKRGLKKLHQLFKQGLDTFGQLESRNEFIQALTGNENQFIQQTQVLSSDSTNRTDN